MLRASIFVFLYFTSLFIQPCFAAISLSVEPVDGSNSLRFDRIPLAGGENKEEIHIRVTSTNGDRFQVFQRILDPIVNEKGDVLNLQAVESQTLPNSNSSGTLYLQNSDHWSMGDQLLYSSGQTGSSDMFIVGYSLNPQMINVGGKFRGRLIFTVRGMGNASSDQVIIDVFLETSSSLKISVKGEHDPNQIHIRGTDTSDKSADSVNFSFSGNSGQEIRIYQEMEAIPQNERDEELGRELVQLDPQGQTEGLRMAGLTPLVSNRTLIYSSSKSDDNFIIYFLVNAEEIQSQDAGTYRGKINYVVETNQGRQVFPIDVQMDVPPIFSLDLTQPPGGVSFTHVLVNSPPQEKEVMVTVHSNLHKPYQVLQEIQTAMTNQQGKEFESKYFTIQVQIPSDQSGRTDYVEFSPVQTGEYPVFSSDGKGSGASFEVVYRLQGYNQMSPGDFSAPIRFSLNQK